MRESRNESGRGEEKVCVCFPSVWQEPGVCSLELKREEGRSWGYRKGMTTRDETCRAQGPGKGENREKRTLPTIPLASSAAKLWDTSKEGLQRNMKKFCGDGDVYYLG